MPRGACSALSGWAPYAPPGLTWSSRRPRGLQAPRWSAAPGPLQPLPHGLHCTWRGQDRPSPAALPAPRAYQPHAADCLGSKRSGVRCHRTRLETRTKELHSAASGRDTDVLPPDAQRKQVSLQDNARRASTPLQRGPLALGFGPGGQGG